jgi:demethylmenaquinone methyltransferase/2-methoxy-6-polyprenyl-1,4-benzoquinol methylase
VLRELYNVYFSGMLPIIGRLVSGHHTAYSYLPKSVQNFPGAEDFAGLLRAAGLSQVGFRRLMLGTVAIHWGVRAE